MTAEQLRELAERATHDPDALAELRRVEDVSAALAAADSGEALERARLLADSVTSAAPPSGDPAAEAARVLADDRFSGADVPRPFEGALRWLGERIEPVTDWIADRIQDLSDLGGPALVWGAASAAVLIVAWLMSRRVIRSRSAVAEAQRREALLRGQDPAALEREADAAEASGEWELAIRLRFRAGVLRLAARGLVDASVSLTTGEVARAVGSPEFASVGERFDAIVYGGAPAGAEDAEAVRAGWKSAVG